MVRTILLLKNGSNVELKEILSWVTILLDFFLVMKLLRKSMSQYPSDFLKCLFYYVGLGQERSPKIHSVLLPPET